MSSDEQLLTIKQAADEFAIPRIRLWRWMKAGELHALQSGRDRREKLVRRGDIRHLLEPRELLKDGRDV